MAGWDAVPEPLADRSEPLRLLLAPVAPKLAAHAEREYGQEELLRAAVDLVRELAGPAGAVVVFEDLHWADAESVALFGRLADHRRPARCCWSAPTGPTGVSRRHPLAELLAGWSAGTRSPASPGAARPGRRGRAASPPSTGNPVPFRVAEALHRRTGGNPFFLEELVVTAGEADPAAPGRPAAAVEPGRGRAAPRSTTSTPTQRRVVDAAAVLGRRIPFDLLAAVTGSGEDELIGDPAPPGGRGRAGRGGARRVRLPARAGPRGDRGRLLGRERRRLHEAALAALLASGGDDWAAVARHAQGAGRFDEMVEAARGGAWSYLQLGSTCQALRLAETGLAEADRDLSLLSAASKAAWMIGLLSLAIEYGERWHTEAAASGDPVLEAAALIHLARLYWEARDFQRQWQTVRNALAVAEPLGESETLARAYALAAEAYMLSDRHAEAVEWADKALAMADAVGAPAVRVSALVNKGTALADTVDGHTEGIALLDQAVDEAEAGDFGYLLHRALSNLLVHQLASWPPERSHQVLQRMRETGERTGRGSEAPGWAIQRSEIAVVEGDLETALVAVRDARRSELAPLEGWIDPLWVDLHEASLLLETGDLDQAEALLRSPDGQAASSVDPCDAAWLWAVRLAVAARRDDLEATRAALAAYLTAPAWQGWSWKHGTLGVHGLVAAVRAGLSPDEVRPLLDAIDRATPDPGDHWSPRRASRQHLEAAMLEAAGDRRRALDAYRQVLTTTTSTGSPTCWPTATRGPPAACWPSATSPAPSTTPARPAACSSAGRAGAATRWPPSCAASATARPRRRPGPPDPPRARGRRPPGRRALQRRDRPPPLHLHQDRLGPRLQHPGQARHDLPHRGRHLGRPHRPCPPEVR